MRRAISVAKYDNERDQIWHDSRVAFKLALIRSLGPTFEGAIGPPPEGFRMISVQNIMDDVKARYGRVDQVTFGRMEEVLARSLDHVQNLEKLISSQKRHMLMQMVTLAGYCVHSTVVPAIVPKLFFAPSEEIDGKELLFSNGGGCYE